MQDHLDKVAELLNRLTPEILETAKRKLKSGAIDVTEYENEGYRLARILLYSALEDAKYQVRPFGDDDRQEIKNLESF